MESKRREYSRKNWTKKKGQIIVRMGDYKLIERYRDNSLELYNLAEDIGEQQNLAEKFAKLLTSLSRTQQQLTQAKSLEGLAEMAAGAAHELNNPLAVISGRAQLLSNVETEPESEPHIELDHAPKKSRTQAPLGPMSTQSRGRVRRL